MLSYLGKKLIESLLTLFAIATIVFFLMRLMPEEGYFEAEIRDKITPEQMEAALQAMGLRDPLGVQLLRFYNQLLHGDFGTSITVRPKVPVAQIIGERASYSIRFGIAAVALSFIIGIPIGVMMTLYKGKLGDKIGNAYVIFIQAVPAAVYYLFIQLYATSLLNLPILYDKHKPESVILPIVSMSLGSTASHAMWVRRYMVDQINSDYVKFARAKGLKERSIMYGHVLRNALVPMTQTIPTSVLLTISGTIYIESLYSIPGMGNLLLTAIKRQDNPVVQSLVIMYAALSMAGLILGDFAMAICDPRIKIIGRGKESR